MRRRTTLGALVVGAALLLAACSGDDADDAASTTTAATIPEELTSTPEVPDPPTECAPVQPIEPGVVDGKPESVALPEVPPTDEVVATVLREGDGPVVGDASYVTVHYLGVSCTSGAEFDSSWSRGEPISVALGSAPPTETAFSVIPGWTDGLTGQAQGSLVQIDIPPALAYGEAGRPGAIAPNDPLTFVVELIEVSDTPPA